MKIYYTDLISGEGYDLYLDSVTGREYLHEHGDYCLWETENAGETKIRTLVFNCLSNNIKNTFIKRGD